MDIIAEMKVEADSLNGFGVAWRDTNPKSPEGYMISLRRSGKGYVWRKVTGPYGPGSKISEMEAKKLLDAMPEEDRARSE